MPPKKTKLPAQSSSQPLPQSRTAGRKRRTSDSSSVSEQPGSIQGASGSLAAPAKRRRKAKAASVEPQPVIAEEEEETIQVAGPNAGHLTKTVSADTIEVSNPRSKHVRFDGPPATDEDGLNTATNLTPHPRKTNTYRRVTLSPSVNVNKRVEKVKTTVRRTSLPSSLGQNDDPTKVVQELQFSPLRDVLDERVRRRLKRSHLSEEQNAIEDHEKRDSRTQQELEQLRRQTAEKDRRMRELEEELEMQRQFHIEVDEQTTDEYARVKAMQEELSALKEELGGHIPQLDGQVDVPMANDDMLVLDSQEEIVYPNLPDEDERTLISTKHTATRTTTKKTRTSVKDVEFSESASQANAPDTPFDAERKMFEDAIMSLSREANDAKVALQILTIELQSLGFAGEAASNDAILESIRESFQRVRVSVEEVIPGEVAEGASSEEFFDALVRKIDNYANKARSQDEELAEKHDLITKLGSQVHGLLDHLADAEIRKNTLERQWQNLDEMNEQKDRTIENLEEEFRASHKEIESADLAIEEIQDRLTEVEGENANFIKDIEKLKAGLEGYMTEEKRLMQLIEKMEFEHQNTVAAMNREREETVAELENQLAEQANKLYAAEGAADQKQLMITELKVQSSKIKTDLDALQGELKALKADRDAEVDAREQAEADVEERNAQINDLETRVSRLEDQLEDMNSELATLRSRNDTERQQREAAEVDLDRRDTQIADLNNKLRESGTQANELRQKLYEIQMSHEKAFNQLVDDTGDREEQYQEDMANEVQRREEAESLAEQRLVDTNELEERLGGVERTMRDLLDQRDQHIATLEEDNMAKDNEIAQLRTDLQSADDMYQAQVAQSTTRIEDAEGSIVALQLTISTLEGSIIALQSDAAAAVNLHNSEMQDRNASIADLNHKVAGIQSELAHLVREKEGLERRVESEAEAMLELQATKDDEIQALKHAILDKQAKILAVEDKAAKADKAWTDVLNARDETIQTLTITTDARAKAITGLSKDTGTMKRLFRDYKRRSDATVERLQEQLRAASALADEQGDVLKADGDRTLEEMEALDSVAELHTAHVRVAEHVQVKKARGRPKKRLVDSGIGMAEGEAVAVAVAEQGERQDGDELMMH